MGAQTARRYRRTAIGANTTRIPTHHANACQTSLAVGPPRVSARTAEAVADTGWCLAKACSHPGIEETGTNAEEANTSGSNTGNAAAWAASGSPTASPTVAKIHDIEYPKRMTRSAPPTRSSTFVWIRHPTRNPTTIIRMPTNTFLLKSAIVLPVRTAERAIGRA